MLHKAWNSKGEMPYCFPRSFIKFQGLTVQNITDFDPNWAFPDYRPVAAFKSLRFALFHMRFKKYFPVFTMSTNTAEHDNESYVHFNPPVRCQCSHIWSDEACAGGRGGHIGSRIVLNLGSVKSYVREKHRATHSRELACTFVTIFPIIWAEYYSLWLKSCTFSCAVYILWDGKSSQFPGDFWRHRSYGYINNLVRIYIYHQVILEYVTPRFWTPQGPQYSRRRSIAWPLMLWRLV